MAKSFDLDIDQPVIETVQRIAEEHGVNMAQIAMAWVLSKSVVASAIAGATKPHHLADAVRALTVTLSADDITRLEAGYTTQPAYWW